MYRVYINGFWGGFSEKTDANHFGFFELLFRSTPQLRDFQLTTDINDANVLFESVFQPSLSNAKDWSYKIQYSGEPRVTLISQYNLTLYSEPDSDKVLDLPLFVYYIHGNNLLNRLIHRPIRTVVPSKFCCFIVSNGRCQVRNKIFSALNQYKKVESFGKFANNMGTVLTYDYWSPEFTQFISNYKFIICFENSKFGTYSTEKIVNPYLANTIPIYWSSHHIKNVINPDSMLFLEDERDESYIDLINRVIELDNDDAKYLEYANRPVFNNLDYWYSNYSMDALSCKLTSKLQTKLYMKFFVTHYTPLVERKQNIIRNLNNAGIEEYTFIEIKDRDVLTPEELSKFKNITSSEVSLFLKHVEIFKAFDDDGLLPDRRVSLGGENELVVVFEDDAILCDDFLVKLETCLSQLQNEQWDVLFSGECCNLHTDVAAGKVIKQTNLSRGACMYVLNSGVGKRLYDIFKSQRIILDPIDWWFNKIQSINKLNYFWSEPTLVSQGSDTGLFKSSLRGEPKL